MLKDVVSAKPIGGYKMHLRFEDGVAGDVDISGIVKFTGIFAELADLDYFSKVSVHPELGTIAWPNGADIDPDVLYAAVSGNSIPGYSQRAASGAK